MKNHAENVHQKLDSDPLLILVNNPKHSLHQEIILKIRCFDRGFSKSLLKKSTLFFLSNPVPFRGQNYQKHTGSGTSDQSLLGYKTNSEKFLDQV